MIDLPTIRPQFASQPLDVPWPIDEWPRGDARTAVDAVVDEAFTNGDLATTNAVLVVVNGRVIAERYFGAKEHFDREPEPINETTPLISWSMAKSFTHALVGILVGEGRLDPDEFAPVPEWSDPSDPRHQIRLRDLLAMRDGLDFCEDYVDDQVSNVIEMLFGSGRDDTAGYTARRALKHPPGSVFNYSSGTTNVISRIVSDLVGRGEAYERFMRDRLFTPIGMTTATPTFDDAGVFIGSSFIHAPAREFAKFGLLYLRGGRFGDHQIISEEWAGTAQVPLSVEEESGNFYSWQWWVTGDEFGTYWASGYDGQQISIAPALDAIIVRLGRTPAERNPLLRQWRHRLLSAIAS